MFSLKPLVFIQRGTPFVSLKKNGKEAHITANGKFEGIDIRFITKEMAVAEIKKQRGLQITYCNDATPENVNSCLCGAFENSLPFQKTNDETFAGNQIWYGEAEYNVRLLHERSLFLQGVADFLTVKNGEEVVFAGLCSCNDVIVPGKGNIRIFAEKWGHCNFDDARKKITTNQISSRHRKNI